MKEKVLRDSQIRSMHGVKEVCAQKIRVNYETIQKLTSQLQEMQEQMNSMNDSGEFQEVESNHSGRTVLRSQSACSDSKFSFHAQPWQTLASWHMEYIWIAGRRFRWSNFYVWFTPELLHASQRAWGSVLQARGDRDSFRKRWPKVEAQFQCRRWQEGPSTMSSLIPVEFLQNSMVGQQRQQISELQFDNFPYHHSFLVW